MNARMQERPRRGQPGTYAARVKAEALERYDALREEGIPHETALETVAHTVVSKQMRKGISHAERVTREALEHRAEQTGQAIQM